MTLNEALDKHSEHEVAIIMRLHKGRFYPVPGLYCQDCSKLIKWLNYDEAADLLAAGVKDLGMLPEEEEIWQRRIRIIK